MACIRFVYTLKDGCDILSRRSALRLELRESPENVAEHGVSFELAREAFFDPFLVYDDATAGDELRQGVIGRMSSPPRRLLYAVSVEREGHAIRIISARRAEPEEEKRYDHENG